MIIRSDKHVRDIFSQFMFPVSVFLAVELLIIGPLAANEGKEREWEKNYVGAEACKQCHASEYDAWLNSNHASAFSHLSVSEKEDSACIQCHSTGLSTSLQNIQCESCHGAGKYFAAEPIMKNRKLAIEKGLVIPTAENCESCHNAEAGLIDTFDYADNLKKIRHWGLPKTQKQTPPRAETPARAAPPSQQSSQTGVKEKPSSLANPSASDDEQLPQQPSPEEEEAIPSNPESTLN